MQSNISHGHAVLCKYDSVMMDSCFLTFRLGLFYLDDFAYTSPNRLLSTGKLFMRKYLSTLKRKKKKSKKTILSPFCLFIMTQNRSFHYRHQYVICATSWQNLQSDSAPSEDSDQPNQSLRCALNGQLKVQAFIMRTTKTLIRLGRCPGWSESSLGAQDILLVLSWCGSYKATTGKWICVKSCMRLKNDCMCVYY